MYISLIKIYPVPGDEHKIIDVLDSMKGPMATLRDCLGCMVSIELGDGGAVCYMERWRTREALNRHLRSQLYGRVLEAMEFSSFPPSVDFMEIISIGGLDLVEKARMAHKSVESTRLSGETS